MVRWLPVVLMVIGLVLAAGAAGLMAFRPVRARGRGVVRAVARGGAPVTVVIDDTGPARVVRIEPHASPIVTTTEERRP